MISTARAAAAGVAAGLLMVGAFTAPAAAQTVEFRGEMNLSGFSSGCAVIGFKPNTKFAVRARFRPPGVGDNDGSTRVALFTD
jgi:hypothetical protein